jgi:AraC family transcriptional regulator, arabinose operon regulatory protein
MLILLKIISKKFKFTMIESVFRIGRVQYGPGTSLGPRSTIEYEFVRILRGHVIWTYDGESHELKPGTFILSQPGHQEHFRWDVAGKTQHDHIHFKCGELPLQFPEQKAWPRIKNVQAEDILHALFQHIVDLNRSIHPQRFPLMQKTVEQMLSFWVLDLHHFEDRGFKDFSPPVQRVMDNVHSLWRGGVLKPPSLEEMIAIALVSRSSFVRSFQEECGQSPSKYFEQLRLHLGRLYLLETNRTMEDIANILGYQNPFHFSKNFKGCFELSPREFRSSPDRDRNIIDDFTFQKVFNILASTQVI